MKDVRVLLFPAGTEIGMEIFDSLKDEKGIEIFGGTSSKDFSSFIYSENHLFDIPFVSDKEFIPKMVKICKENKIKILFPAHDEVIKILSENQSRFTKVGTTLAIHPGDTSTICRSKRETYDRLKGFRFLPKHFVLGEQKPTFEGPFFVKPTVGQGSKGVFKAQSIEELELLQEQVSGKEYIVCEYLSGKEFTVDCFTDLKGELIFCEARERATVTNGISVSTSFVEDKRVLSIAKKIQSKITMQGPWFFQVKEDSSGNLKLLEVGARVAGSSTYNRLCGTNLSLMNFYQTLGMPVEALPNLRSVKMHKRIKAYSTLAFDFKEVFCDFDDTVIVNEALNLKVMSFLMYCLNQKIKLTLITRHKGDIHGKLHSLRLDNFFDQIIHITDKKPKSNFIKNKKSIFIDDSFVERKDVVKKCKIPVFSSQTLPEIYF